MKLLVISDSHGNIENLKHVMGFAKKFGVSAIIHGGDWNTIDAIETVSSFGIPVYTVLGNADVREEVVEMLKTRSEKFGENFLEFELGGRKIGVTHKPSNNKKYFLNRKLDLIINGHLHSKYESQETAVRTIRPGAIINGNNFAIYNVVGAHDTASDKIEFIEDDQV